MTPLLVLVIGVPPVIAVGTDLAYRAITKTVGGWQSMIANAALMLWAAGLAHLAVGTVDLALMANILAGSLPGVWLGTRSCRTCRPGRSACRLAARSSARRWP